MGARLLIAVGQAASDTRELPFGVRQLIRSAEEVLIIAPTLPGRFEWLASATDKSREQADKRLQAVLGQASELGADARGAVAADDPILAFEDAVVDFAPEHILIGLRSDEHTGWQERGLLDKVVERFGLPVTVFQLRSE